LIFSIVIICLGFAIAEVDPSLREFAQYMRKYNKHYTSGEFDLRFLNYKASVVRIAEENHRSKKAKFGINKFSDMSTEEFQKTILMKDPIVPDTKPKDKKKVLPTKSVGDTPTVFDWREKGAVTPVKDQEQCGSCWAFSVTENVESMWILAGKATNHTLNLSPQQIVDCDTSDAGCDGGDPPTAYEYIIGAGGLEPLADYPYTAEDGNCNFNAKDVQANISNWHYATEFYLETEVQSSLLSWGPLSICVDASNWQDYQSGVMSWEDCGWINVLDHCVQLVGYNSADSSNNYWVVRNSWNTDWGIEGYIWLEMWRDTCGLTHEATCSVV